jgi:hypothetical protein
LLLDALFILGLSLVDLTLEVLVLIDLLVDFMFVASFILSSSLLDLALRVFVLLGVDLFELFDVLEVIVALFISISDNISELVIRLLDIYLNNYYYYTY